jgi:hypothetical protein
MGSSPDDLLSFAFSSTLDIESSNDIYFLYHAMGFALGHSCKSLLLMYMYTLLGKCGVVHYAISLCNHKSELSSL